MSSSASSIYCNDTQLVIGNFWFWTGEVFKLVSAPTAAIWNSILIVILWKSSVLHINVHILLINISCCATLSSLVILAKSLFTLIVVIMDNVCWIRVPYHSLCQFQTGMFFVTQLPIFGSIAMLGFERLYATLKIDTYEINSGSNLAKICVTLLWLISIKLSIILIVTVPDDVQLPYCSGMFMLHRNAVAVLAAVLPVFVFLGTLMYVSIWASNRRQLKRYWINQARYSLAGRLQRQHNVAITEMMLPAVLLQAICWTVIMSAVAVPRLKNFNGIEQITLKNLIIAQYTVYLIALIHMNMHPLLCLWYGKMFHNECRKLFPFTRSWWPNDVKTMKKYINKPNEMTKETEQHFQLLDHQWKKAELKMLRDSKRRTSSKRKMTAGRYAKRRHSAGEALKHSSPDVHIVHERFKERHRSSVMIQSEPVSYAPIFGDNEASHV